MSRSALGISVLLALGLSSPARAERGLVTASLQVGQVVSFAPGLGEERALPLQGTLTYGLAERWALGLTAGLEFQPGGLGLGAALGPRFAFLSTQWLTVEAFLAPGLEWRPAGQRFDVGARLGVGVRYFLLWGVGLSLEGGVRGRLEATNAFAPSFQGYLVGGLFIEA